MLTPMSPQPVTMPTSAPKDVFSSSKPDPGQSSRETCAIMRNAAYRAATVWILYAGTSIPDMHWMLSGLFDSAADADYA